MSKKPVQSVVSTLGMVGMVCLLLSSACASKGYRPAPAPAAPARAPSTPPAAAAGAEAKASPVELEFWSSVKDSKDPAQLEAYLKRYPSGAFVEEAKTRLAALKAR